MVDAADLVAAVGAVADFETLGGHMDAFDQFWAAYPRKTGKGVARKAFAKAVQKATLAQMLTALAWQRTQPQWLKAGGQYIPHPSTWLHQERWDDEPTATPQLSDRTARTVAAIFGRGDVLH